MEPKPKNYYYQIPSQEGYTGKLWVIGVIDCSGSMAVCWKDVANLWNTKIPKDFCTTILFDTKTKVIEDNLLKDNVKLYGGGGTLIPNAFHLYEKKLREIPEDFFITTIFISDGKDNHAKSLEERFSKLEGHKNRRINFICLGIQSEFPTFLSMRLRSLYHSGDTNIPALYLVEYASEKAFYNKFETMRKFFSPANLLDVIPPVKLYPWEKPIQEVYENSWISCDEDVIVVNDLSVENIVDIFRGWTQKLQLISLEDPKYAVEFATIALKEMKEMVNEFQVRSGINLEIKEEKETIYFSQKAIKNFIKHIGSRIYWFIGEVENIRKGILPKSLDEYEAAKKIGLGTITGKFFQKALALKIVSIEEFKAICNEFLDVYKRTKLNPKTESTQEKSVVTLQNQKEVFLEDKLLEGLKYCKSQFDLVEAFPIIGHAIQLKRFEGSNENPWHIQVKYIAKHHKGIDSTILVQNQMKLELKVGGEEIETINAVLPLFSEDDHELKPLINSRLYRLLITYNVMFNPDAYSNEAYLSLLGHTQEDSEWKTNLFNMIYSTLKLTYSDEKPFKNYLDKLIDDIEEAFVVKTLNKNKPIFLDFACPLIHIFYLWRAKLVTKEKLKQILDCVIIEFFYRLFVESENQYEKFISMDVPKEKLTNYLKTGMDKIYCVSDFKEIFNKKCEDFFSSSEKFIQINYKHIYSKDLKLCLETLERIYETILEEKINPEEYIFYLYHVNINRSENHRFVNSVVRNFETVSKFSYSLLNKKSVQNLPFITDIFKDLRNEFTTNFMNNHWDIEPITQEILIQMGKENNVDISKIKINSNSDLPENACIGKNCPYFLQCTSKEEMKKHLDTWVSLLPNGFHKLVKKYYTLPRIQIYELLKKEKGFRPYKYQTSTQFTLNYITKVKNYYCKINNAPIVEDNEPYVEKEDDLMKKKDPKEKKFNKPKNFGKKNYGKNKLRRGKLPKKP